MAKLSQPSNLAYLVVCVVSLVGLASLRAGEPETTHAQKQLDEILQRLERIETMLKEQQQKVNRLYNAVEPHLAQMEEEARRRRQQAEEDAALAMSEVLRKSDEEFTGKCVLLPDTDKLLLARRDATLQVVEIPSGKDAGRIEGLDAAAECLAAVPGLALAYAGTSKGTVYRVDLYTRQAIKVCDTDGWPVDSIAASADGRFFAWATNGRRGKDKEWEEPDESAHIIDAGSGDKVFGAKVGRGDWQAISFSKDGNSCAIVQNSEVVVIETATGKVRQRLRHPGYQSGPLSVAYSPAEPVVAIGYAPHHVALWNAESGKCLKLLPWHTNWVVSLSFTADGCTLVSSAGDLTASVWDVATGKEVGRLRFGSGAAYVVSVSAIRPYVAIARRGEYVVCRLPGGPGKTAASEATDLPCQSTDDIVAKRPTTVSATR